MRPIVRYSLPCAVMLLVAACQDRPSPVEPGGISALVSDGAHGGGNPDFFFLPPLVGDPSSSPFFDAGKFNGRLLPVMAVFKGTDQCSLSNTSKKVFGPAVVPVVLTLEQYKLEWNTSALRVGTQYRLCIFGSAAGKSLGFLDLMAVSNGLKNIQTGDVVRFQQGRVIPVKFRIERGALSYNPDHPSEVGTEFTVDKTGGSATLVDETGTKFLAAVSVPANAVPQGTVTVVVATEAPKFDGKCLPTISNQSNGCYQIRTEPELFPFAQLVRVEICVDPSPVDLSLRDSLRLFKFNTTQGLVALQRADPTLIGTDCSGSGLGLNDAAPLRGREGVILQLAHWAGRLVAPRELHAAVRRAITPPKGIGGLVGSFSDFGGAVPACADVSEISTAECNALVALYTATDGPNWTNRTNWLETNTPCSWYGVNCVGGLVTDLNLGSNNLTGTLPPELGNLLGLRNLHLFENQLSGPLPATLGQLGALVELIANHNHFTGSIPAELGAIGDTLRLLFLNSNELSGAIPAALGNLGNLQVLALSENQLSGAIPAQLGNLSRLQNLRLQLNSLSGVVPLAVAQLGGRLEGLDPVSCSLTPGNTLTLGSSPDYRAADLDGDGLICGLPVVPVSFTDVESGYTHSCGLTAAGTAYCWGFNQSGQLGDESTTQRLTPVAVHMPAGKTFATIAVGGAHNCGLTAAGEAYCWGENNNYGQLGDGTLENKVIPVAVQSGDVLFASITAGGAHTCALTASGQAYCWGYNFNGQLGDNSTTNRSTPVQVAQPEGVTFNRITAGGSHTCALTAANVAYCWGWNEFGQLGDGGTSDQLVPVAVQSGGASFATLSAGGAHTCGKTPTGDSYCWGVNIHGELGDGTNDNSSTPVQVPMPSGVDSLTPRGGGNHTCGLTYQGAAYCWGFNDQGQLGDGTTTNHNIAAQVSLPAGVIFASMSPGLYFTCALTPDGAAYCWGDNRQGQLGDGTTSNRSTPVVVR
jgi:alpha-tubulin suppressor-like RCC1 family protein